LRRFINDSNPIYDTIEEHGWLHAVYLGPFGLADPDCTRHDLWYCESEDGDGCFVAQYGDKADMCFWHTDKDLRDNEGLRGMYPELDEAMQRFDYYFGP
jgi:hypothetical protein